MIVGAGFGGLFTARALAKSKADITLIDRQNHHLFQPLLYQVATAGLAPSDVAWPIRAIVSRQKNVRVRLDEATGVDLEHSRVLLRNGVVDFDFLVLATGAQHAWFGHDDWSKWAPGLKSIDDATAMRRRLLVAFEKAENSTDAAERSRLLQFVIVGAGPTGVELAGAIAELAHHTLARDFRNIDPRSAKITLIEAGERVLPSFTASMSSWAKLALERLGVDVCTGSTVTNCDAHGVQVSHGGNTRSIATANVIWAAGVAASAAGRWLKTNTDRQGRVIVRDDLSIESCETVFVIGDTATVTDSHGAPIPGTAVAAKQQGRYVGRLIRSRLSGKAFDVPFRFKDVGNLATIGRRAAVVELGRLHLKGRLAWWLWGIAHIYFLVGPSNRLIVAIRWLWEYVTYGKGARLIVGNSMDAEPLSDDAATPKN